jgi:type II secretory pathway component PulF
MALYTYKAFSRDGKQVKGSVDASSREAAREQLARMGLFPTEITIPSEKPAETSPIGWLRSLFFGISIKDKIFFTKQLSLLLKAGVPLLDALTLLSEQTKGNLHSVLVALKDDIKEGSSLADGLSKFPRVFDTVFVQLVKAGEASGKLEVVLDRLSETLEKQDALSKKIRGALTYPIIQLVIISLITVVLLVAVVPQLAAVFKQQKAAMPWSTTFLIALSEFLQHYYLAVIVGIILFVFSFTAFIKTPTGNYWWNRIKLKIPLVGYFSRMGVVVLFSRTLGMLLEAGVNLSDALDIVVKIVKNPVLEKALSEARENIIKQGRVAQYLKETDLFPPVAIYLINTGEQSGSLDTMLLAVAQNYEADLSDLSSRLSTLLEPFLLVLMAAIVGFIVFSIMSPIMKLTQLVS